MEDMQVPGPDSFLIPDSKLKIACIVLGIINSVVTFLFALFLIMAAVDVNKAAIAQAKRDNTDSGMPSVVYTILLLLVVLLYLKVLFDLIFVGAVLKERISLVKKYCIFWVIFLVLFIIGFLKTLYVMGAGIVIGLMAFLAGNIYFICIIRSYLKYIRNNHKGNGDV